MNKLNRFNWIARSYDELVKLVFGDTLHQAEMHFVNEIGSNQSVLILGGGSGKFLSALLRTKPAIQVTYIEASSEMIALAKTKVDATTRVEFVHGTEQAIPSQEFDVVITNFFLDLFQQQQVESLVGIVSKHLKVNGKWLVTDFEKSSKLSHRVLLSLMYLFFTVSGSIDAKTLPKWRPVFQSAGLKLRQEKLFRDGFVSTTVFSKQ